MKNYQNIEKSAFKPRQYVGYSADGRSWRITGAYGAWTAISNLTRQGSVSLLMYDTLGEISYQLEQIR